MSMESFTTAIQKWAATKPEIAKVYLFGSRLRGKTHDGQAIRVDSDLDVAVQLNIAECKTTQFWIDHHDRWEKELRPQLPWPLDLELYEGKRTRCLHRYLKECSELVFERPDPPEK